MPPPCRSDRKAIWLQSREKVGSDSSAASCVSRAAWPVASCCSQISRLPCPARSDANAISLPSGENAGSVVSPESKVSCVRTGAGSGAGRWSVCQTRIDAVITTALKVGITHAAGRRGAADATPVRPDSDSSRSSSSATFTSIMW